MAVRSAIGRPGLAATGNGGSRESDTWRSVAGRVPSLYETEAELVRIAVAAGTGSSQATVTDNKLIFGLVDRPSG